MVSSINHWHIIAVPEPQQPHPKKIHSAEDMPANVHRGVSANIIMSKRQMQNYKQWQQLFRTQNWRDDSMLPTATEYDDFHRWLTRRHSNCYFDLFDDLSRHIKKDSSSSPGTDPIFPVAKICRHKMLPITTDQLRPRCPTCVVSAYLKYLSLLSEAVVDNCGDVSVHSYPASARPQAIYRAWIKEKIDAQNAIVELEKLASEEAKWSLSHPTLPDGIHTATSALAKYWFETTGVQETITSPKKTRHVSFSQETNFVPGRGAAYYWRRSLRYEPAKHIGYDSSEDEIHDDNERAMKEDSDGLNLRITGHTILPVDSAVSSIEEVPNHIFSDFTHYEALKKAVDSSSESDNNSLGETDTDIEEAGKDTSFIVFSDD